MKPEEAKPSQPDYRTRIVLLLSGNAMLGGIFLGYVFSVFNPMQKFIQDNVYPDLSVHLINLVSSLTPFGGAFGAIVAATLNSLYGRRKLLIWADILAIIAIIMTVIPNPYILLAGRLLSGVCCGLNGSVVPVYNVEVSPVELRGVTGTFNQVSTSLGMLFAFFMGLGIPTAGENSDSEWWRFMLGIILFVPIIRLIVLNFLFKYETPKFLLFSGNENGARETLNHIYTNEERVSREIDILKKEIRQAEITSHITYKDLVSPYFRTRFIVGLLLITFQQINGASCLLLYSTEIFRRVSGTQTPQIYTFVLGIILVTSCLLATALIRRTGRRPLLLIGGVLMVISLLIFSVTKFINNDPSQLSTALLLIFMFACGFSFSTVTFVYLPEILPDLGMGIAVCLNWVLASFVAQSFPYLISAYGDAGTFLIVDIICVLAVIFVFGWVKETHNKDTSEIGQMYSKAVANPMQKDDSEETLLLST